MTTVCVMGSAVMWYNGKIMVKTSVASEPNNNNWRGVRGFTRNELKRAVNEKRPQYYYYIVACIQWRLTTTVKCNNNNVYIYMYRYYYKNIVAAVLCGSLYIGIYHYIISVCTYLITIIENFLFNFNYCRLERKSAMVERSISVYKPFRLKIYPSRVNGGGSGGYREQLNLSSLLKS